MKSLTQNVRRFDQRIVDYWSWPVRIGIVSMTATTLAILFPPLERNFTKVSIYRYLDRPVQYALAVALVALLVSACLVPYWGGVVCALVICPMRMAAYTNAFNLAVYAVYGAIMFATVMSVRSQYRLRKWVVVQKGRFDGEHDESSA